MSKNIIILLLILGLTSIAGAAEENIIKKDNKNISRSVISPVITSPNTGPELEIETPWITTIGVDEYETFESEANLLGSASVDTALVNGSGSPLGTRVINFGDVSSGVVKANNQYIQIGYTTNYVGGAVAIHTFNADPSIPVNPDGTFFRYAHDWGYDAGETWTPPGSSNPVTSPEFGAGLVLANDGSNTDNGQIMKAAPLLWAVFDTVGAANIYAFTGLEFPPSQGGGYADEGATTDPMQGDYDFVDPTTNNIDYRTVVWWGYGNGDLLSMFGRNLDHDKVYDENEKEYSTDSLIFVTVAGDFRDVPAGGDKLYGTKRLIVEVFHQ